MLRKVYELVLPATQTVDLRLAIDKTQRQLLRQTAEPLLLGEMGLDATHFVVSQHWKTHFGRKSESGSPLTVEQLRKWIDDPRPMGLPPEAENLVILFFAALTNRTFYRHNGPWDNVTLQSIPDDCELRTVDLPPEEQWEAAVQRAGSIFGLAPSRLRNTNNVSSVSGELKKRATEARPACQAYVQRLRELMQKLGIAADAAGRMRTAVATQRLVERLHAAGAGDAIRLLAEAEIATSESAMGECFRKGAELEGNLDTANWDLFDAIGRLTDDRKPEAQEVLARVRQALTSDEHALPLAVALKGAQASAVRLLTAVSPPAHKVPAIDPPARPGRQIIGQGAKPDLPLAEAQAALVRLGEQLKDGQTARVSLSWVIEQGGAS